MKNLPRQGYDYQVSYNNGAFSEITHIGGSSLMIENFRQYANITIRVRASANGAANKVNSAWTEWTWTNSSVQA